MEEAEPPEETLAALRAENARLAAENARLAAENVVVRRSRDQLRGAVDHAPAVIYIKNRKGRFVFSNSLHAQLIGATPVEVVGKRASDFLPPEHAAAIDHIMNQVFESGVPRSSIFELSLPGGQRVFQELMFPVRDAKGEIIALCAMATDITETRRAEEKNTALQAELIASQERLIRELSAPLIPIADGVVILPVVGSMTQERGALIARALLGRVHADGIHTVLFDITGMTDFDVGSFQELMSLLQAMRLLGARSLLTGVSPKLAKRFLMMGELKNIETVSTVQVGVALALSALRPRG